LLDDKKPFYTLKGDNLFNFWGEFNLLLNLLKGIEEEKILINMGRM